MHTFKFFLDPAKPPSLMCPKTSMLGGGGKATHFMKEKPNVILMYDS